MDPTRTVGLCVGATLRADTPGMRDGPTDGQMPGRTEWNQPYTANNFVVRGV